MKPRHLLEHLAHTKDIASRCARFDPDRAQIEAGGYLSLLLQDPFGRTLVRSWAVDFRRRLSSMVDARAKALARISQLRDAIVSAVEKLPRQSEELSGVLRELPPIDARHHSEPSLLHLLDSHFEPYTLHLETALCLAKFERLSVDYAHVKRCIVSAVESGDAGTLDSIVSTLEHDRRDILYWNTTFANDPAVASALNVVKTAPLSTPEEIAEYVIEHRLELVAAIRRTGERSLISSLSFLWLLGGFKALALKQVSLEIGPRHPWWATVRLLAMSKHADVGVSSVAAEDHVLAKLARDVVEEHSPSPATLRLQALAGVPQRPDTALVDRLLLELEKVHSVVRLAVDRGRDILAGLSRYRQRFEWYDDGSLDRAILQAERVKSRLVEREKYAVRHLANWLFDQGYTPLSRVLGRGKTDLEGVDEDGAFVVEAKILTDRTLPKTQAGMDDLCRRWAIQALDYADSQGVDWTAVVVFNRTSDTHLVAVDPQIIAERITLCFLPITATLATPSKKGGSIYTLRHNELSMASK